MIIDMISLLIGEAHLDVRYNIKSNTVESLVLYTTG